MEAALPVVSCHIARKCIQNHVAFLLWDSPQVYIQLMLFLGKIDPLTKSIHWQSDWYILKFKASATKTKPMKFWYGTEFGTANKWHACKQDRGVQAAPGQIQVDMVGQGPL